MRPELTIKTRSLAGSSDLTLFAPIKLGFVPSLESVTYKTRVKRLLDLLNTGRSSSHEYSLIRPFSDAVERVGRIHSVRVAIVEPEDKVLLAVTFDGPWESYIRVLWQKVGALLDVIFCNTDRYVSAYDHSFEEWLEWAHRVQIETAFFYGMPAITVDDVRYLKSDELLHREHPAAPATDFESTRRSMQRVESVAWDTAIHGSLKVIPEVAKLGLQSLAALYRLTDLYLPAFEDGKYLHRAARELLLEFVYMLEHTHMLDTPLELVGDRFDRQLAWIRTEASQPHGHVPPELPTDGPPAYDGNDVQGGILHGYGGITHGCLLLIAFDNPAAAANFLTRVIPEITLSSKATVKGELVRNIAFTCEGLRAFGLSETQLSHFPQEFREGMEARASVLGDFRINHPRRWRLPVRNWPVAAGDEPERIELSAVHAVLQLRMGAANEAQLQIEELSNPNHPLHGEVKRLLPGGDGVRLFAVEPMGRYPDANDNSVEHFGFVDGISQPEIAPPQPGTGYSNQVHLGELLLGYANEADPAPADSERMAWLRNGSFLVVRKLRQDVKALEEAVARLTPPGMAREDVLAKMMGRRLDGTPLMRGDGRNDFDYVLDPQGSTCPFQAHIRRANPRSLPPEDVPEPPGRRTPRLMRRGMSYGPQYIRGAASDARALAINAKERGVVFMAYNASIAEQFEVVQRWLNGGNSTGVFSDQSDPFLGVAENGQPRIFRFEHQGAIVRMAMDGWNGLLEEAKPIVRLEWGAYLFTPSMRALAKLQETAAKAAPTVRPVWSAAEGLQHIQSLEALQGDAAIEAWKIALEDPESQRTFVSASIWAAIREYCGGVLRTPYGVLVADHDLVMKVLQDDERNFTVEGEKDSYRSRMKASIGEIYLGLDATDDRGDYAKQSAAANAAIHAIEAEEAYRLARRLTARELAEFIRQSQRQAMAAENKRWELTLDLREVLDKVLASLCDYWFGVLETGQNKRFLRGGVRWDWKPGAPPYYPGNFTAPSRYIFQPNPGPSVVKIGQEYGVALTKAMALWIEDHRGNRTRPAGPDGEPAPIGNAIFGPDDNPTKTDLAARTMVGVMMGFLPPADGNLRLTLNEWLHDGTFWALRAKLPGRSIATYAGAMSLIGKSLCQAMQLRPSPELVWRTVAQGHTLRGRSTGEVVLEPGEKVIVSVVSATQQCLVENNPDTFPVFGGDRSQRSHPTHACPGYKAAMGVIAGVLAGLLEVEASVRPSLGPVALVLEGPCPEKLPSETAPRRKRGSRKLRSPEPRPHALARTFNSLKSVLGFRPRATTMELLAWGDSWLHYKEDTDEVNNIAEYLRGRNYKFTVPPLGFSGIWLQEMAQDSRRKAFRNALERMLRPGSQPPRAILLSGGGNDVVKQRLANMLNPASAHIDPIIEAQAKQKIDVELRDYYVLILNDIKTLCTTYKVNVPVLLHPYDHPIPDGRLFWGWPANPASWLYPYITTDKDYDLAPGIEIMKRIIDRLHDMQKKLAQNFSNVIVVPVPGTLDPFLSNYKDYWENELHLRPIGFDLVGKKFADVLGGL